MKQTVATLYLFMYTGKQGDTANERLAVEDVQQRQRIISSIHDSSHFGVARTTDMVACKYYWPGLSTEIACKQVSVVVDGMAADLWL